MALVDLAIALDAYQQRRCSLSEAIAISGTSATGFLAHARALGVLPTYNADA